MQSPKIKVTHTYHSRTRSQRNKQQQKKKIRKKRKKTSIRATTHNRDFFFCSFLLQLSEGISASARFPPSSFLLTWGIRHMRLSRNEFYFGCRNLQYDWEKYAHRILLWISQSLNIYILQVQSLSFSLWRTIYKSHNSGSESMRPSPISFQFFKFLLSEKWNRNLSL